MSEWWALLLASVAGSLVSSALAAVPALHIYSVAGFALWMAGLPGSSVPAQWLAFLFIGLTVGYAMVNGLPGILLSAPDDSTAFVVLPGQRYMLQGRGYEAVVLTGMGGLLGVAVLALLAPVGPAALPALRAILQPHLHWVLWAVIAFTLISEWPKGSDRAPAGFARWWDAWRSLVAGLVTFLLSGILGFILLYRSPTPTTIAYQKLHPAFAGLFAIPWILQNLLSRTELPAQRLCRTVDATPGLLLRGALAGTLGGLFAAFFPAVTGGIGALLAGHATAQRDDRLFIIAQGANKVIYYGGALLFLFVPRLHLVRGGMAHMLSSLWTPHTAQTYYLAVAAVVLTGVISFLLLLLLARLAIRWVGKTRYQWINLGTLAVLLATVGVTTGWQGLFISGVATGIGLIPVLWGSRRANCMGVLLLPLGLNLAGVGSAIARLMGLV